MWEQHVAGDRIHRNKMHIEARTKPAKVQNRIGALVKENIPFHRLIESARQIVVRQAALLARQV